MKIIFFIDSFPAGGKERQALELMKGLVAVPGNQLELVVMTNDIHYKEIFDLGIKIHFILRKTKRDFSVFRKFYRICKDFQPDIVQCWDSMTAVYVLPAVKLLRLHLVNAMIQDAPAQQSLKNKVMLRGKLTFPFSDAVVGNSLAGLRAYAAPARKSVCIYNGYDSRRTQELRDPVVLRKELNIETPLVAGMVATFSFFKDYPCYFKAAALILEKRKDITFLAIGDHTDSAEAKKLIPASLANNFRLMGRRTNIESWVNMMDVCVLSTFTEGISNSILEYMAMEKPVVATDGGGTNELVEEGKNGFMVRTSDATQLAGKISFLLDHPETGKEMGRNGRQKVLDVFSNEKMINTFIQLYESVLRGKVQSFSSSLQV